MGFSAVPLKREAVKQACKEASSRAVPQTEAVTISVLSW